MFNKYYQDELNFLRDMGKEFSQSYPALAHMLAERGSDPDVERLLEGFAFLAARIRQKLDDEFPEVTHGLLALLWPHYLRPVPAMSTVEFRSVPNAVRERVRIPRWTEVASVPVEGTRCLFRTCYDVDLYPLELTAATLEERPGVPLTLRLTFQMTEGVQLKQVDLKTLRLFILGEPEVASLVYLWLSRHLTEVRFEGYLGGHSGSHLDLGTSAIRPAGFADDESLLPYPRNSFPGFRILQEYFTLAGKFMFFDIDGLDRAAELETGETFDILLRFGNPPGRIPRLTRENFRLYCTPVVNLFGHTADPIRLEHDRVEYRLRPASVEASHYEIYSVDRVAGWAQGESRPREYTSFYSFTHDAGERPSVFYQTRLRNSVEGEGTETSITFVSEQEANVLPPAETVSVDLTCTNRRLPSRLRVGDISAATGTSPEFATFRNITGVTASVSPPLGQGLHWRLLSHLSLNYLSLVSADMLRSVLELYNFQALYDRQASRENQLRLEAIRQVRSEPLEWLVRGVPVRGTSVELELFEANFTGEGDMYLFSTILNELFALWASMNSLTRLTVRGARQGEVYQWAPRVGRRILV